jgi:arginyl-tRNA synthetase
LLLIFFIGLTKIQQHGQLMFIDCLLNLVGDYQFNGAMQLSQLLKASTKENPRQVAATLAASVQSLDQSTFVDTLELAGPGFINIRLKADLVRQQLAQLVIKGVRRPSGIQPKRVVVDFSSPNVIS